MGIIGANPSSLEELSTDLDGGVQQLTEMRRAVRSAIHGVPWTGPEGAQFRASWDGIHGRTVERAISALTEAAEDLRRNAREQRDASAVPGGLSSAGGPYETGGESWERTVKSGVIGKGVDGSRVELIKRSDGTFLVRGTATSSFELSYSDAIDVASLAAPKAKALAAVAGFIGGAGSFFGTGRSFEVAFDDEAEARAYYQALQDESNEVLGADGLRYHEMYDRAITSEQAGTSISFSRTETWSQPEAVVSSFDAGSKGYGLQIEGGTEQHGSSWDGSRNGQHVRYVTPTATTTIPGGSIGGSAMVEYSVFRNNAGEVVGIEVVRVVSPEAGAQLSSAAFADAATGGGVKGAPGFGAVTDLISGGGAHEASAIDRTSTVYDLDSPAGSALAMQLGCTDPSDPMTASQIRSIAERADTGGVPSVTTSEVFRHESHSTDLRLISYDSSSADADWSLVSRTVD